MLKMHRVNLFIQEYLKKNKMSSISLYRMGEVLIENRLINSYGRDMASGFRPYATSGNLVGAKKEGDKFTIYYDAVWLNKAKDYICIDDLRKIMRVSHPTIDNWVKLSEAERLYDTRNQTAIHMPTFMEWFIKHHFDISALEKAGFEYVIINNNRR